MRVSQQIGWSQESKLIFELIKETEKLNTLLPGGQPSYNVNVSRQIGWSNESNLYYEWLNELAKVTAHAADCCTTSTTSSTSTTTTTTTAPPVPCYTFVLMNNTVLPTEYDYVNCEGTLLTGLVLGEGQSTILCARDVIPFIGTEVYNVGGDPCNSVCTLYNIDITDSLGGDYSYTDCNGNFVGPVIADQGSYYVCANDVPAVIGGSAMALNLCQCISYTLVEISGNPETYSYIGCDLVSYKNQPIGPFESITICSLTVPVSTIGNVLVTPIAIC